MTKKLTLEQTWKYCLAMWKWIIKEGKKDESSGVISLKRRWMIKHPQFSHIEADCFFCHYDRGQEGEACLNCPGVLVDKRFSCGENAYDHRTTPAKFYKKLVELNKKRKSK